MLKKKSIENDYLPEEEDALIWDEKSNIQHEMFVRIYLDVFNESLHEIEVV